MTTTLPLQILVAETGATTSRAPQPYWWLGETAFRADGQVLLKIANGRDALWLEARPAWVKRPGSAA